MHEKLVEHLTGKGVGQDDAYKAAEVVATIFGKLDTPKKGERDKVATTLAFISPQEWQFAEELAEKIAAGEELPSDKDMKKLVLRRADGAIDIAMFGRMLANDADYNREAAVQVAHAIGVGGTLQEIVDFADETVRGRDAALFDIRSGGFGRGNG